jgi:hypothetical protein
MFCEFMWSFETKNNEWVKQPVQTTLINAAGLGFVQN